MNSSQNYSKKHLKKAFHWAKILGRCPGVTAIFLSGSIAQNKASKASDIDFFILTTPGLIWTARFSVFSVLKLFKQIATEKNHAGNICPNHFISTDSLEIKEQDAYSAKLFTHNLPLYDPQNIFPQFMHKNKNWIKKFDQTFIHKIDANSGPKVEKQGKKLNFIQRNIEKHLKKIQIQKIKRNKLYTIPGAKIVLEDTELRFHPRPKNK